MYDIQFFCTNSAGWAAAIELIDDETDLPLDVEPGAVFELAVKGPHGSPNLTASTDAGTIERPSPNVVQWRFTPERMTGLCAGNTYRVGLTATDSTGTVQFILGTLAVLDGVV